MAATETNTEPSGNPLLAAPALIGGTGMRRQPAHEPRRFADGYPSFVALVFGVTLIRIAYLWFASPYGLTESEAELWLASQHPELSYLTNGPVVPFLLGILIKLFGTGEAAIRTLAAITSMITAGAIGALAADVARSPRGANWRVGFYAAMIVSLAPLFQLTGLLTTIDGPGAALWALAAWAAWRAFERASISAWFALGTTIGLGFLASHATVTLVPGLLMYALVRRASLNTAKRAPLFAFGSLVLAACISLPSLLWNHANGWPTAARLIAGVTPGRGWRYDPMWTLEFVATQLAIIGPALLFVGAGLIATVRRRNEGEAEHGAGRLFLVCCALPLMLTCFGLTFIMRTSASWTIGAYVTLLALAGWLAADMLAAYADQVRLWKFTDVSLRGRRPRTFAQHVFYATFAYGLICTVAALRIDWLATLPTVGPHIPITHLASGPPMGADAGRRLSQLEAFTGERPLLIASDSGRAAQLAFYAHGRPTVVSASSITGEGRCNADFWVACDPTHSDLLGRPALLIGSSWGGIELWRPHFERVEPTDPLEHDPVPDRPVFVGFGYLGPQPATTRVAETSW